MPETRTSARKSLAIYLPDLAGGGIERLCLLLAPAFVQAGWDVSFVLQSAEGELIGQVPTEARVVPLDAKSTLASLRPLASYLRREKPDVLLACHDHNNIVALWARRLAGVRTRTIVSMHNAASATKLGVSQVSYAVLPLLDRLFFPQADGVIAVSRGVAWDLAQLARLAPGRITVIYNPIVAPDFDARMAEAVAHPWLAPGQPPVILGVGRFVEQKDFATLVEAFARAAAKKDVRLILLGNGPLRENLLAQSQSLGVADRLDLPGFQPNPLPWMRAAAMLALSSRYEGFGNVLVEALACGTPVISTDCTFGPSEILDDGRFGRLVPVGDAAALAEAIGATLDSPPDANALRSRGREFTVDAAARQYLALFDRVVQGGG